MLTSTYISKDQNWQDETTTYWFEINGTDYGTEKTFECNEFGIAECNGKKIVIEIDGSTVKNEYIAAIVLHNCKITQEMIDE